MEELKELIQIVSRVKVQKIEIIGQDASNNSQKSQKLYDGIINGDFENDEAAAIAIYGHTYKKDTYQKLKQHLEKKLLNTLFFMDITDASLGDMQLKIYQGERILASVRILRKKGAFEIAVKLAKGALKNAVKYGLSELVIGFARILEEYHITFTRNEEKSQYYSELKEKYYKLMGYELYVESKHYELMASLAANNMPSPEALKEFDAVSKKIAPLFEVNRSFKFLNLGCNLTLSNLQLQGNYEALLLKSDYFLTFLDTYVKHPVHSTISIITSHGLEACIHLQKYQKGEALFKIREKVIPRKTLNWLGGVELFILLYLHTKNWTKAYQFYFSVESDAMSLKGKAFKLPQERLSLYKCYLLFLRNYGTIKLPAKKRELIKLGKIINQIPSYAKNKRGINIPILIVQFLIILTQRDRVALQKRMDALTQYAWRYLKNDFTLRSNCFIKMLGCVIKADFHRNATIRTSKKYYKKLLDNPACNYLNAHFIEVIPYEDQWELVLSLLDNKAR